MLQNYSGLKTDYLLSRSSDSIRSQPLVMSSSNYVPATDGTLTTKKYVQNSVGAVQGDLTFLATMSESLWPEVSYSKFGYSYDAAGLPTISSGKTTVGGVNRVGWTIDQNVCNSSVGCIRFLFTPSWAAQPSTATNIFVLFSAERGSPANELIIAAGNGGAVGVVFNDEDGDPLCGQLFATRSFVSGAEYEFEFDWNTVTAVYNLFINGVKYSAPTPVAGTRSGVQYYAGFNIMRDGDVFGIRNFRMFNTVQHTAACTVSSTLEYPAFKTYGTTETGSLVITNDEDLKQSNLCMDDRCSLGVYNLGGMSVNCTPNMKFYAKGDNLLANYNYADNYLKSVSTLGTDGTVTIVNGAINLYNSTIAWQLGDNSAPGVVGTIGFYFAITDMTGQIPTTNLSIANLNGGIGSSNIALFWKIGDQCFHLVMTDNDGAAIVPDGISADPFAPILGTFYHAQICWDFTDSVQVKIDGTNVIDYTLALPFDRLPVDKTNMIFGSVDSEVTLCIKDIIIKDEALAVNTTLYGRAVEMNPTGCKINSITDVARYAQPTQDASLQTEGGAVIKKQLHAGGNLVLHRGTGTDMVTLSVDTDSYLNSSERIICPAATMAELEVENATDNTKIVTYTTSVLGDPEITATWCDLSVMPWIRIPTVDGPTLADFGNASGSFGIQPQQLAFAPDPALDRIHFSIQLPHSWVMNSTINPHIYVAPATTMMVGPEVSKWILTYGILDNGGATAIPMSERKSSGSVVALTTMKVDFTPIVISGLQKTSATIYGSLRRDTDSYLGAMFLLGFNFHIQTDKINGIKTLDD